MNKIVKNFLSVGFSTLLGQLFTFLIIAYYAQILGKESFGSITLAQQIILYFTMTVPFGLQTYGMRSVAENKNNIKKVVGEIITFRLALAFICYCFLLIIILFINKDKEFENILLILGLTLFPTALSLDWIFNGLQEMKHNAIYTLCKNLIPCGIIYFFFSGKEQIYLIPVSMVFALIVGTIYYFYIFLIKEKYLIKLKINKEIVYFYVKCGYPFFISGIFGMINNNIDKIIIGFARSSGELGIYQAAYTFIGFLINLVALIFIPVFPLFVNYYKEKNERELQKLINNTGKMVALIATPLLFGGVILSEDIILLFYKTEYISATIPFAILLLYIFILFFREIYAYQLNAWNLEKMYLKIVAISSILNLLLNILFTPKYGMIAAAWITTITEIINLVFMRKVAIKVLKTDFIKFFFKTIIPAVIMSVVIILCKVMNIPLLITIAISIIIYFIIIFLLKIITIQEIKNSIYERKGV